MINAAVSIGQLMLNAKWCPIIVLQMDLDVYPSQVVEKQTQVEDA